MKGILLIRFNKSPGAYVDIQYPSSLIKRLDIKTSDLMNLYGLHRMRRTDPNYLEMKIKDIRIASFYTGFSFKNYIGKPDFVVAIILEDREEIPENFEGLLRSFAFEISKSSSLTYHDDFVEYYKRLGIGVLEPYWDEYFEDEGTKIATIQGFDIDVENINSQEFELEEIDFDEVFGQIKDDPELQISELQKLLAARNKENVDLKQQIGEQEGLLDDWQSKLVDLNKQNIDLLKELKELKEKLRKLEEENQKFQDALKSNKSIKSISKASIQKKPSEASLNTHDGIREKWLAQKNISDLEGELLKINMNTLRDIVKPWDIKPKGRTKKDLITAITDYIQSY